MTDIYLSSYKVRFQQKVYPEKIEIHETWHSGAVKRIQVMQPNSEWYTIWETTTVQYLQTLRTFSPHFEVSLFQLSSTMNKVTSNIFSSLLMFSCRHIFSTHMMQISEFIQFLHSKERYSNVPKVFVKLVDVTLQMLCVTNLKCAQHRLYLANSVKISYVVILMLYIKTM